MKTRKLFIFPAICRARALTLRGCGEGKKAALRKAADKAGLIVSKNGKTITGVKAKGIESIVIPNGVTSIGSGAFSDCRSLTSVAIPDSVTSIGDKAFENCFSLTSVAIGNGVTSIGLGAFRGCEALTSVTIPSRFTDEDVKKWKVPDNCKIIRM